MRFTSCLILNTFRDQLKLNYNAMDYFLDIDYDDLKMFDEEAANKIKRYPATFLPAVSYCKQNRNCKNSGEHFGEIFSNFWQNLAKSS